MKRFKFVIEFSVDPSWVADGFDINKENVKERMAVLLPHAHNSEFSAKVISRPTTKEIKNAQGY
jgi:hypothetical protein